MGHGSFWVQISSGRFRPPGIQVVAFKLVLGSWFQANSGWVILVLYNSISVENNLC